MSPQRHGISIGFERIDDASYLVFRVVGKLSHADYELITPMLDSALAGVKRKSVKALLDCTECVGWEARALWDELKLGLRYDGSIEKAAVVGNAKWMENLTRVGNWLTSSDVRYFESEGEALDWLGS